MMKQGGLAEDCDESLEEFSEGVEFERKLEIVTQHVSRAFELIPPRQMGEVERDRAKKLFDALFDYRPSSKDEGIEWLIQLKELMATIYCSAKAWHLEQLQRTAQAAERRRDDVERAKALEAILVMFTKKEKR